MTRYFLDSSAVTKRYVPELGTSWVRQLTGPTSGHTLYIAQITPAEIISGLARQMREGLISSTEMRKLRLLVDGQIGSEYSVIALSASIIRRAEDLLLTHPLRAYNAVQLASALDNAARFATVGLDAPVFVSADRRLLAAAEAEGLLTDDPNQHV